MGLILKGIFWVMKFPTQLWGIIIRNHEIMIPIEQSGFHGKTVIFFHGSLEFCQLIPFFTSFDTSQVVSRISGPSTVVYLFS